MQANTATNNRVRKTVNDVVMAEMFLLQATIESVAVIGDGISEIGKQIASGDEDRSDSQDSISSVLQRIADEALEPYTSRYKYFRKMLDSNS
jgi:hypothetical protein